MELALDFEIYSGLTLPAAKRRAPGTVPTLVDRAKALSDMLTSLTAYASPQILHGGERKTRVYSLARLGVHCAAGLSRRPILLIGAETEQVVEQISRSSLQGAPIAPGANPKGWWQHFIPSYPPDRVDRLPEWELPFPARSCTHLHLL